MFDIGWSELVVIGVVALIAIGPKELPGVLRTVGQWMGKIRRMASEFQSQFQEAMREAEMADLKKEVDSLNQQASSFTSFDPVATANAEIQKAIDTPVSTGTDSPPSALPQTDAAAEAVNEAAPSALAPSAASSEDVSRGEPEPKPGGALPA